MKRIFLASASLAALMTARPVFAAKAPPMVPVPYFSWTGCYVGGNVGGGWGSKELTDGNAIAFSGLASDAGVSSINDNISGWLGGGQIGCNYQFAKNWVIGIEGDLSGADIQGNVTALGNVLTPVSFSARTDWIGSVAGRLGYAWDRWLAYAKGGPAWAGDKYQASNSYYGTYNASETRSGWTLGGGLEWAFADHWSARLEYSYYDFGNRTLQFTLVPGSGLGDPVVSENVKQQIQQLTVGLNYRF